MQAGRYTITHTQQPSPGCAVVSGRAGPAHTQGTHTVYTHTHRVNTHTHTQGEHTPTHPHPPFLGLLPWPGALRHRRRRGLASPSQRHPQLAAAPQHCGETQPCHPGQAVLVPRHSTRTPAQGDPPGTPKPKVSSNHNSKITGRNKGLSLRNKRQTVSLLVGQTHLG